MKTAMLLFFVLLIMATHSEARGRNQSVANRWKKPFVANRWLRLNEGGRRRKPQLPKWIPKTRADLEWCDNEFDVRRCYYGLVFYFECNLCNCRTINRCTRYECPSNQERKCMFVVPDTVKDCECEHESVIRCKKVRCGFLRQENSTAL